MELKDMEYKDVEKYIDDYIDMGCFRNPKEAKPYLIDGFQLGFKEALKKEFISVKDELPEINEPVIVFYQIPGTARKYYDHIEIGKLKSIIIGKDHPITKWWDLCQNVIVPTHWQPRPEPPKEENR